MAVSGSTSPDISSQPCKKGPLKLHQKNQRGSSSSKRCQTKEGRICHLTQLRHNLCSLTATDQDAKFSIHAEKNTL